VADDDTFANRRLAGPLIDMRLALVIAIAACGSSPPPPLVAPPPVAEPAPACTPAALDHTWGSRA